jgi:hypothetical protein
METGALQARHPFAERARLARLLGPLSGMGYVGLTATAAIVGDPNRFAPGIGPHQAADTIAVALLENQETLRLSAYLMLGGVVFLFFLLACLREALRRGERPNELAASVAFAGGLVVGALSLVGASIAIAASELPSGDPLVAKTLLAYGWDFYAVLAAPAIAAVGATAIGTLRGTSLPRWFGWFSVGVAVLLVGLLVGRTAGLGVIVFVGWAGVASIALLRRHELERP